MKVCGLLLVPPLSLLSPFSSFLLPLPLLPSLHVCVRVYVCLHMCRPEINASLLLLTFHHLLSLFLNDHLGCYLQSWIKCQ